MSGSAYIWHHPPGTFGAPICQSGILNNIEYRPTVPPPLVLHGVLFDMVSVVGVLRVPPQPIRRIDVVYQTPTVAPGTSRLVCRGQVKSS